MNARELHRILCGNADVVDRFTGRGTHLGCGECCSRFLPLTFAEAVVLRHRAQSAEVSEQQGEFDLRCPFLTAEKRCSVYDVRPEICRVYDCAEHKRLGSMAAAKRMDYTRHHELYDMRELIA